MRRPVCCFAAVFAAVVFLAVKLFPFYDPVDERAEGRYVTLQGTVGWAEYVSTDSGEEEELSLRLSLQDISVVSGIPGEIPVNIHGDDKALCVISEDLDRQESMAGIGAKIRIRGKLRLWRRASNDGEFDAELYYGSIMGYLFSVSDARILAYTREKDPVKAGMYGVRSFLSERIDSVYAGRYGSTGKICASAMKAILLGETGLVDDSLQDHYRAAGIVHVLCISGLHISMFGMGLYNLLKRMRVPAPAARAVSAAVIVLYSVMTGMHTSCLRAVIMFLMRIAAEAAGRTYDMLTAMSVAAVLILIGQPFYICHSGFLFSFCAVAAAGTAMPLLPGILKPFAIPVFTIPVHLAFYYTFPTYSLVLNLLVIALMPAVMAGGAVSATLSSASFLLAGAMPCASVLLKKAAAISGGVPLWILLLYDRLSIFCQKLPLSTVTAGRPPAWEIPVYYLLITGAMILTARSGRQRILRKAFAAGTVILALAMIFGFRVEAPLSFYMLDVGQGDGMCVMTGSEGGNLTVLIDGGSSSRQKLGEYVLVPFLKYHGISEIDYCIVTHDDIDHCSGVLELIGQSGSPGGIRIRNIALPSVDEKYKGETYLRLEEEAAGKHIPVTYLSRGMILESGSFSLTCLHPERKAGYEDANAYSVVLGLRFGAFGALLTGDLEGEGEEELIRYIGDGHIDTNVFKAAHHGSGGASSQGLVDRISFDKALISCGKNNRYGHPSPETVKRLLQKGAEIFDTRITGQVSILTDGEGTYSTGTFY